MAETTVAPLTLSIPQHEAAQLLREHYGIDPVRLTELQSELSTVMRIDLADGSSRVFRASCGSPEELALARWRIDAADHLAARGVPTARTVPARDGAALVEAGTSDGPAILHVGEWLNGSMLADAAVTPGLMRAVGRTAAEVSAGLATWPAPPAPVGHPWELVRALDTIGATMDAVTDPAARSLLDEAVSRFTAQVQPRLPHLPQQVVHQDLHDSNLLIDPATDRVTGVLDFGDMVRGPRIADLAVPATHSARSSEDPAAAFLLVAEGWGRIAPLEPEEIDLVFTAGLGRLAVNLSVWTHRATTDRADYAHARSARTAHTLSRLLAADPVWMHEELHRRLGSR